jgi:ABC-type glycerol-3-phosphate transport system substrate-binding protein
MKNGEGLSRREFLKAAGVTGAALSLFSPAGVPEIFAQGVQPWSYVPKAAKPKKLVFHSWKWGERYDRILPRFEKDWGIPLVAELTPPGPTQFDKAYQLFGAGEQLDVLTELITDRAGMFKAGMLRPINDMPGVDEYVKDFHDFAKDSLVVDGKIWGLPYFVETWVPLYYIDKLRQAGFERPFSSWEELVEQGLRAKKDKVCEYPLLWPAGVGTEQLPGCWYGITWSMGGVIFEKDGRPALGSGSVARKALQWFQDSFLKWKITDPRSLGVRFIPAVKAYNMGQHIYLMLQREYYLSFANDPAQSPIAGKVAVCGLPNGRIIGAGHGYSMCTATASPEWAWKLLQLVGGKTKDGEYAFPNIQLGMIMGGSGFKSVMTPENYVDKAGKWLVKGNAETVLQTYTQATSILKIVPVMLQTWYRVWVDMLNVEVQKCLRGEITVDQCCDNLIKAVDEAKKKG